MRFQTNPIGMKAASTLLHQRGSKMPEGNRFSLLHDHIPVISGLVGQTNYKAKESPQKRPLY